MQEKTRVQSLGWEDPLEKEMATHSCLENPMDGEAWETTVHGIAESDTPEWLHFLFFLFFLRLDNILLCIYMYNTLLIHLSLDAHWACFHFLDTVN